MKITDKMSEFHCLIGYSVLFVLYETNFIFVLNENNFVSMLFALMLFGTQRPFMRSRILIMTIRRIEILQLSLRISFILDCILGVVDVTVI